MKFIKLFLVASFILLIKSETPSAWEEIIDHAPWTARNAFPTVV